jgi:hypothetical protein
MHQRCLARVEDTLFAPKPLTQQAKAHPHLTLSASEKGVSRPRKDLSPLLSRSDSNSHALNPSRVWTCSPHRAFPSLVNFLSRVRKAKISDACNRRTHTHTPGRSLRLSYLKRHVKTFSRMSKICNRLPTDLQHEIKRYCSRFIQSTHVTYTIIILI